MSRTKDLSDLATEQRYAALGQRPGEDCRDDEAIDALLLDAILRELRDVLQQMRKELARNGPAVGRAQCVEDAALDGFEPRKAAAARHDVCATRPRSPVSYRTNGIP